MNETALNDLQRIVGQAHALTDPDDLVPHVTEWRGRANGVTPLVLKPGSTAEVSAILAYCNQHSIPVVPQGGNTGLCGGAVPDESGTQVVLNLSRLNAVRAVNPQDFSITAEAGCVLQTLQETALEHDRLFPLSLASEGSCQIGGNLSTDAGGINVIRYGTAREQVLGLEVVLANGEIIDGLRSLRKDTGGYDLKQLFLGSEGTLGVITAACLKLYPDPGETTTALVSLYSPQAAIDLLSRVRSACGNTIDAFELISALALDFLRKHKSEIALPLEAADGWAVLLELSGNGARAALQDALMEALEGGDITDAVITKNDQEAADLWSLRHAISEVQKYEGISLKHDIGVSIDRIPELLERGSVMLEALCPGARLCAFGHVGDGNLHYNISEPLGGDSAAFAASGPELTKALYDIVLELGGTFSAEHGVGSFKKDWLAMFRSDVELRLMRRLKDTLDPKGILNPGKVI
jgi:FAD/FMN-containing dehydrogenase